MKKVAAYAFIDHRFVCELAIAALAIGAFLLTTDDARFDSTLDSATRLALYTTTAGISGALLGFVLAALAILIALPSTERLEALREHERWPRVPSAFFRAARSLLVLVTVATLGIALDSDYDPWVLYEAVAVALSGLALVRVAASVVALDQVIGVARVRTPLRQPVVDP